MKAESKWAFIATIALFVWLFIEKMLGLLTVEKFGTWTLVDMTFSILMFIVVYYLMLKEKRDTEMNGVMSWTEGFWAAARMSLILIPLLSFAIYIFLKFVSPDFPAIFNTATEMAANGKDGINNYLMANVMSGFFFGGLFSLVFPFFTKRSA